MDEYLRTCAPISWELLGLKLDCLKCSDTDQLLCRNVSVQASHRWASHPCLGQGWGLVWFWANSPITVYLEMIEESNLASYIQVSQVSTSEVSFQSPRVLALHFWWIIWAQQHRHHLFWCSLKPKYQGQYCIGCILKRHMWSAPSSQHQVDPSWWS